MKDFSKYSLLGLSFVLVLGVLGIISASLLSNPSNKQELRSQAAGTAKVYFQPQAIDLIKDQTTSVNLMIDPAGYNVSAVKFTLKFDPAAIKITDIIKSADFPTSIGNVSIDNAGGTASALYSVALVNPIKYNNTITSVATVYLQALTSASSTISFIDDTIATAQGQNGVNILADKLPLTITGKTASADLLFNPASIGFQTGGTTNIDMKVNPTEGSSVSAVKFSLQYNPQAIKINSITPSNSFSYPLEQVNIDNTAGHATGTFAIPVVNGQSPTLVSVLSTVGTINIQALSPSTSTISYLNDSVVTLHGVNILSGKSPLSITVANPTPTPTNSPTPTPTNSPTPTLTPTNSPTPTFTPTPTPVIIGDLDHNNIVDIFDFSEFVKDFGWRGTPGANRSDFDKNGVVDIFDFSIFVDHFGEKR